MGDFRFDEKGRVRYEPSNLADAALMFSGDWDAAAADLAATLPDLGKADVDRAIERGEFLLTPIEPPPPLTDAEKLKLASVQLGEAMPRLADGGPVLPPEDHDGDDDSWDGDDDDDGTLELILGAVILMLAGATVWRIVAGLVGLLP